MAVVLANFLRLLSTALLVLIFARVIVSWVAPQGGGGLIAFIYQATEPFLAPIRRVLPPTAGIDWSPLVALLLLGVLNRLLFQLL